MESRSIEDYIFFGTEIRFLQDVKQGMRVHDKGWILHNIDGFLGHVDAFQLPVTQRACGDLMRMRDALLEVPPDRLLTSEEAVELKGIMGHVRRTVLAEAGGNVAFIVTDKRIDVNKLLRNMPALFAPGVADSLPDIAHHGFSEAGRCIAFELPTAAAFHILRATEGVLRHFYCCVVRQKRVTPLMWGPMVESLRARQRPPPRPLLDNLDNIRLSFRNPTQHPDKIYDIQEVQDLFSLCVDVVNRMATSKSWLPS